MTRRALVVLSCLAIVSACRLALADQAPGMVIDDMEDLAAWRTGGQKEASLSPERTLVKQGKQALRFDVRVNWKADETIEGKQYPQGWPRVERNPRPTLDLSAAGGIEFDVYTLSSRAAMPGSSLHIILRDASGDGWQNNLGQLPLKQWQHFRFDFGAFKRSQFDHWQFFLSESDYQDGDQVSFIIDNVRGYPAQRARQTVPRLAQKLAALNAPAGSQPPAEEAAARGEIRRAVASAQERLKAVDKLDLAASNAFDAECDGLLTRLADLLMRLGAARTVPDGSYCVGVESGLRKVFRDDTDFTPGRELKLTVAGNEREAGQIIVRAMDHDIPRLAAECSDLAGPRGAKIKREQVQLSAVGYVEMLKTSYRVERTGWWPDPLIPLDWPGSGKRGLGPLADAFAHQGETQPLWLSVVCPAGTPAGEYKGTVTLQPEGLTPTAVSLAVRVRNFSLPLRPRLKTAFSFFEGQVSAFYRLKGVTPEQRRSWETFLLDRKLDPMLLYTPFAWPGLEDVEFMAGRGLNAYCLGYTPATVQEFGDLVYYRWLRDQRAWLAERGLDQDAWVYGYDEPHCRPDFEQLQGVMRDVYAMVDRAAPGMPRGSTTAIVPPLFGAVNLWIPQTMQVVRQDTLARQQAGDQVWTYVACTPAHPFANLFLDYPALEHRLLFWQTWQDHCTGFLYYAINLWRPNYEGGDARWPDVPWNPRPEKDFQFNGDGAFLYPGPNATLLSSVRQEVITDGIEDYDYLCLLRDAARALKQGSPLAQRAADATQVPAELSASLTSFAQDPSVLLQQRERVGAALEEVRAALPEGTWQKVLATEAPLSPPAPRAPKVAVAPVPFRADFEAGKGLTPWDSGKAGNSVAERGTVPGMGGQFCALSKGQGKGWADWESPYLQVSPGKRYALRLSAKVDAKAGKVRVFLFKYGPDRLPLDLPTQGKGACGPALLGQIEGSGQWEKRRFVRVIEPGVALARVYLQCFGLNGEAAFDDISVEEMPPDPGLVDDCDEVGGWQPGFPEASASRETKIVHQGDAAINFTVNVDHQGGEEKYPIGWPHLRWNPAPPLDWTANPPTGSGKKTLTFWVYATSSREVLPQRAVNFSLKSEPGDAVSLPLTFPLNTWQQVTIPLAGKNLPAVNHLEFCVEEAAYADKDRVTFIIDDMRVD